MTRNRRTDAGSRYFQSQCRRSVSGLTTFRCWSSITGCSSSLDSTPLAGGAIALSSDEHRCCKSSAQRERRRHVHVERSTPGRQPERSLHVEPWRGCVSSLAPLLDDDVGSKIAMHQVACFLGAATLLVEARRPRYRSIDRSSAGSRRAGILRPLLLRNPLSLLGIRPVDLRPMSAVRK